MEYLCYKDAFDAVVQDNEGVLPDLYEVFDFIIYCRPSNLNSPLTVAEIVAYALLEVSEVVVANPLVSPSTVPVPVVSVPTGELPHLDQLLDQPVVFLN